MHASVKELDRISQAYNDTTRELRDRLDRVESELIAAKADAKVRVGVAGVGVGFGVGVGNSKVGVV